MGPAGGGEEETSEASALACVEGVWSAEVPNFAIHGPAFGKACLDPGIPFMRSRGSNLERYGREDFEGRGVSESAFGVTGVHVGVQAGLVLYGEEESVMECEAIHLFWARLVEGRHSMNEARSGINAVAKAADEALSEGEHSTLVNEAIDGLSDLARQMG